MRCEPDAWSARVNTARPPAFPHLARVGGDDHWTDFSLSCTAQDMHDHRHAGDFGERLNRQAGRG
jgi:hypothetical protein